MERGQLSTSTNGPGAAGTLTVISRSDVLVQGEAWQVGKDGEPELQNSGIFARSGIELIDPPFTPGAGGTIAITARDLVLTDRGGVEAQSIGTEDSGSISIDLMGDLVMQREGLISATAGNIGTPGDISIVVDGSVSIDESTIASSGLGSTPLGDESPAGGIEIVADQSIEVVDSSVSTNAARPRSGNILLQSTGDRVDLRHSVIKTTLNSLATGIAGEDGSSGDVTLAGHDVVVEASTIKTNVTGIQGAGNIYLEASGVLLPSGDSIFEQTSTFGPDGRLIVNAPTTDVLPGLLALEPSFRDRRDELGDACVARTEPIGRFVIRETIDQGLSPDELLPLPDLPPPPPAQPCGTPE
jgi:hypothetical protein